jgi:hypothetical protein
MSIPENKAVYFDFACKPGTLCLVKPGFLASVNMLTKQVDGITDPYIPSSFMSGIAAISLYRLGGDRGEPGAAFLRNLLK